VTIRPDGSSWHDSNQRYLVEALASVRNALTRGASGSVQRPEVPSNRSRRGRVRTEPRVEEPPSAMQSPPALERLCAAFGLSSFERGILLMCAGVELDAEFAEIVKRAHQDPRRTLPTFGLALAALGDAHWSALTPAAPLRRWQLVESTVNDCVTAAPLRIDERVLHCLAGISYIDERLRAVLEFVPPPAELAVSHEAHVARISTALTSSGSGVSPVIQLCGDERAAARDIAAGAAAQLGLRLCRVAASAVPSAALELDAFLRLWQREAVLSECGLLVECGPEPRDPVRDSTLQQFVEQMHGCLIVSSRAPLPHICRRSVTIDIRNPTPTEQRDMWRRALGSAGKSVNGQLDTLVGQFDFGAAAIAHACEGALRQVQHGGTLSRALWRACRAQARPGVEELARRITPAATWDDLVLPEPEKQTLRQVALHVRQRSTVYEAWGFAARSARGLGISALFIGPSGTGKTMAGEVLANELDLDLYHIDLSQVVSKYIGETEKNLGAVFDEAEQAGAVLLMDEADALFGKRSEVRDSHDRYANIESSYLLQRIESFKGVVILTTNQRQSMDEAFVSRLRFVIEFPMRS
jgi:hypothetical protein